MPICNEVESMTDILKAVCNSLKEANTLKTSQGRIKVNKELLSEIARDYTNEWNGCCQGAYLEYYSLSSLLFRDPSSLSVILPIT